jgi:2',3'-cyclic-nucleotide 2'-phosphodiesterase (5'-nucleotidase family)
VVNGVPIEQARSRGYVLGVIDVPLAAERREAGIELRDVVADSTVPGPPAVERLVRRVMAETETRTSRPVATIAAPMPREGDQYALGNLIADAQRWAARGDVALMNNGGIRGGLAAGVATFGTLFDIQPFGNTLVRMRVRGRDLRAYLERVVGGERLNAHVSGVRVTFDPSRARGERIASATLADGQPIADETLYTLVLNDFLATGGDGLGLSERAASVEPLNVTDIDAFIGYLRSLPSPVRPPDDQRLRPIGARETPR